MKFNDALNILLARLAGDLFNFGFKIDWLCEVKADEGEPEWHDDWSRLPPDKILTDLRRFVTEGDASTLRFFSRIARANKCEASEVWLACMKELRGRAKHPRARCNCRLHGNDHHYCNSFCNGGRGCRVKYE